MNDNLTGRCVYLGVVCKRTSERWTELRKPWKLECRTQLKYNFQFLFFLILILVVNEAVKQYQRKNGSSKPFKKQCNGSRYHFKKRAEFEKTHHIILLHCYFYDFLTFRRDIRNQQRNEGGKLMGFGRLLINGGGVGGWDRWRRMGKIAFQWQEI